MYSKEELSKIRERWLEGWREKIYNAIDSSAQRGLDKVIEAIYDEGYKNGCEEHPEHEPLPYHDLD